MTVWLIAPDGRAHPLQDSLTPAFYASGPQEGLRALAESLRGQPVDLRHTERTDLFLDRPIEVLGVAGGGGREAGRPAPPRAHRSVPRSADRGAGSRGADSGNAAAPLPAGQPSLSRPYLLQYPHPPPP